ncbi:shikimate 5-dehydrogenase [Enterococcus sp. DIV2402]|uniref:Shikimate dehydrogenase (NADP(+)) n=1 Tax=Candidatus Enterococcus lowellii TaxID=2230877 RepID=A0ABZ2STP2_9ENTE|nr:shikimate dehydrogenase [Enterococcus sp. DIV2402]
MEKTAISGYTRLVGFLASPAKHSISPKMHNLAFKETNTDAVYLAFDVSKDELEHGIQAIRTFDMLGANVSMPHKIAAVSHMDELTEAAELIGAINTIIHREGKLIGHNTDGIGFCESLRENQVLIKNETMTLLGAGGAATAMICQAALDGMKTIHIFSRKSPRYERMQEKIKEITAKTNCVITLTELSDQNKLATALAQSSLLVNATSVGMSDDTSPISDTSLLRKDLTVYDAIYNPRETYLLKQAKTAGAKTINGLGMLVYQGAAAFECWTGKKMPVEQIKPIIENS